MAEKTLNVVHILKHGTKTQWETADPVLKAGEAIVVDVDTTSASPVYSLKVGDGSRKFSLLPYIQATAGDVYAWAKAASKPTYAASEIQNLKAFVDAEIASEVDDTNTQYHFVADTTNPAKIYVQKKEKGETSWSAYENFTIPQYDDTALAGRVTTLEGSMSTAQSDISALEGRVDTAEDDIDAVEGRMSTAESSISDHETRIGAAETDISNLQSDMTDVKSDISDLGSDKQDTIVWQNNNYDPSTNKAVTYAEIQALEQKMGHPIRYRGHVASLPTDLSSYELGDVVMVDGDDDEYICDSDNPSATPLVKYWRKLGNESRYAIKGAIVNADIADNAAIAQSKIAGLSTALSGKVDKNGTDRLMTANEGTKLAGIEAGAQVNVKPNWNAASGDAAEILNKPTLGDLAALDEVAESNLASALKTKINGKQDSLAFEGTYDPNGNKVMTKNATGTAIDSKIGTLDSSISATAEAADKYSVLTGVTEADGKLTDKTEVQLSGIAKAGNVKYLTQTSGDVLVLDGGSVA